jgi:subtilisin family serine protease
MNPSPRSHRRPSTPRPLASTAHPGGIVGRISWDDTKGKGALGAFLLCALLVVGAGLPPATDSTQAGGLTSVIVRTVGGVAEPKETVENLGGDVGLDLGIIDGFAARVPEGALSELAAAPGVSSVTPDQTLHSDSVNGYDASTDGSSMYTVARKLVDADDYWSRGYTGEGVDVAVIDTGVVPVDGLTTPGKVINGADLSFESQSSSFKYLDTNGHGTFMAGLIAGRDASVTSVPGANPDQFLGMAPDARIVNVKVADAFGATDVSQVIAGIDWVVQHRNDPGMNIRVLNLSFGTDGTQSYRTDPLAFAAEQAWRKGIVVVVSAGNDGYGSSALNNPAYDPYVLAVGAVDARGTASKADDTVPSWSSTGDGTRNPDLVAPGTSIVSLRNPGSVVDSENPQAVVGGRFFRGSGTSQAAAIVSGAAALVLEERPGIRPDQLKALLIRTATKVPGGNPAAQGKGMLNLQAARWNTTPDSVQTWPVSTGLGALERARGTSHLTAGGIELRGEKDIFGAAWNGGAWSQKSANGSSWTGGTWNGSQWTGTAWTTASWTRYAWATIDWSKRSWSGGSWSSNGWSKNSWSRNSWSGGVWTRNSWSSTSFARNSWSTVGWG